MSETIPPPPEPQPGVESSDNPSRAVPKKPRWHWFTWLALAVILSFAGALYWRRAAERQTKVPRTPPPIPVMVAQAEKGEIGVYVTGLGTVTPLNTINVTTRVDGQLMTVSYKEGDKVTKGDSLVEIDPRPFQAVLSIFPGGSMPDPVVAVYQSHTDAEQAVAKVGAASFDIKQISILEKTTIRRNTLLGITPAAIV